MVKLGLWLCFHIRPLLRALDSHSLSTTSHRATTQNEAFKLASLSMATSFAAYYGIRLLAHGLQRITNF